MVGDAGGGGPVLFMREQYSRLLFTGHRPGVSARGRARGGGGFPSNSCLLYFSFIDYINRPAGRPYLARDPYLLKTLLKTLNNY
jgi:hypothetical protein